MQDFASSGDIMIKKFVLLLMLFALSFSLFANTDGSYRLSFGGGADIYPSDSLYVWFLDGTIAKDKYFDGPWGIYYGVDINVPVNYQIGSKATIPFKTFRNFVDFDLFAGASFKTGDFHISLGPALSFFFYQTTAGSIIAQMDHGIFLDMKYDFRVNDTFAFILGVNTVYEYWNTDFISFSRSGLSSIIEVTPYIGCAVFFTNRERFGS